MRSMLSPLLCLLIAPATLAFGPQTAVDTMKAVRLHSYGDASVLVYEDAPRPRASRGQLLVRVKAAGVNPVDWKIRSGMFQGFLEHELPLTLGFDVAGEIVSVGDGVTKFKPGERIFAYLSLARGGGYAQYALVEESEAAAIPEGLDLAIAGATPLAALTAWQCLFDQAQLSAGQRVLVHAGAGGVGHFAVQFAKWKGARVIATASRANLDFLKELGADEVIDYKTVRFEDVVKDIDVVLDTVGADTTNRSASVLKRGGILVSIAGDPDAALFEERGLRQVSHLVMPNAQQLTKIGELIRTGSVKPHISQELPLSEAAAAHRLSESGRTRGKLVLLVD